MIVEMRKRRFPTLSNPDILLVVSGVLLLGAVLLGMLTTGKHQTVPAQKLSHSAFEAEQQALLSHLEQSGVQAGFDYARQRVAADPSFARDCHPLMHHLGHAAFAQYKGFQPAMAQADELCNSGYIHGLIEANFQASPSIDVAISSSCPATKEESFKQWQCFHGMGHGLMYATDRDLTPSIEGCKHLATPFATNSCLNGVFMEKFIVVSHTGESRADVSDLDISLCKAQPTEVKKQCYFYAPSAYLEQHADQSAQAIQWCKQAEADFVGTCTSGVGAQTMKDSITKPALTATFCKSIEAGYQKSCARGALSLYINHHSSTQKAQALCGHEFKAFAQTCQSVIEKERALLKI
jgi:hypothetical protein